MRITRRSLLKLSAAAAGTIAVPYISVRNLRASSPEFEIQSIKAVSAQSSIYYGWPTVAVAPKTDELIVAVSGGREGHICPFGRVDIFRSHDRGETWSWPQTIYDGPIDDRDAGVLVTRKGTILVTSFTSLAYYEHFLLPEIQRRAAGEKGMSDEQYERWMSAHARVSEDVQKKELGCWLFRSTDNGVNWEARRRVPLNSPHGPVELTDGRLFYPGRDLWGEGSRIGCCISEDDGETWKYLSNIPCRDCDDPARYHELHGVEAADGTLVVQIRNENPTNNDETLQTESTDGGKSWSIPHTIGVWGLPSHLIRLADNRLLMTYGHRRNPFGEQVRISEDNGKSWSEPIILVGNNQSRDLGYPSTVALTDGTLVSVWYEQPKPAERAIVKMARWILK